MVTINKLIRFYIQLVNYNTLIINYIDIQSW